MQNLNDKTFTSEPFGDTEAKYVNGAPPENGLPLGEVDFLDLDAPGPSRRASSGSRPKLDEPETATPASFLRAASSFLPSIPFLSPSSTSSPTLKPIDSKDWSNDEAQALNTGHAVNSRTDHPPNPLIDANAEVEMPDRDHHLKHLQPPAHQNSSWTAEAAGDEALPKVAPGQGEGPEVVYTEKVAIDLVGYHGAGRATEEHHPDAEVGLDKEIQLLHNSEPSVLDRLVWSFAEDLLAASETTGPMRAQRPIHLHSRATDSDVPKARREVSDSEIADLDLKTSDLSFHDESVGTRLGHERGQSEPPAGVHLAGESSTPPMIPSPSLEGPNGPVSPTETLAMDLAWDWAKPLESDDRTHFLPRDSTDMLRSSSEAPLRPPERVRTESLPHVSLDLATPLQIESQVGTAALAAVDEDPLLFSFEAVSGRKYTFEVALCETDGIAANGTANVRSVAEMTLIDRKRKKHCFCNRESPS